MRFTYKSVAVAIIFLSFFSRCLFAGESAIKPAPSGNYTYDQTYSKVGFTIKYLGMTLLEGHFERFYGTFHYDPLEIPKTGVKMAIDASSILSTSPEQDKKLKSKDFFWAEKFPAILFSSGEVTVNHDGSLRIPGDLMIKGISKPAVFTAIPKGPVQPLSEPPRLAFEASTVIKRSDYDLGTSGFFRNFGMLAMEELRITLQLEGVPKN